MSGADGRFGLGLLADGFQPRRGTAPALARIEHLVLPAQRIELCTAFALRGIHAGGDRKAQAAVVFLPREQGFRLDAFTIDALALKGLVRLRVRTRHEACTHQAGQQETLHGAPHVREVSTSRRASAKYSADCISRSRETVRGNSCASGPSV